MAIADKYIVFHSSVARRRRERGISVNELCAATGLSAVTIWRIESGYNISLLSAMKVAEFLNDPVHHLFIRKMTDGNAGPRA